MNILITGGAGFIGSHTGDALVKIGHRVRILDALRRPVHPNKSWPSYLSPRIEKMLGDVRKKSDWGQALEGIDAVFHCAAYQDYLPDFSTFYDINCRGTALLYELAVANRLPLKRIIIASSQAVYGEGAYECNEHKTVYLGQRSKEALDSAQWDPVCPVCSKIIQKRWSKEDDELAPHNSYAMSKRAQEELARSLGKRYGIPTVALRYCIVQGPRQSPYNPYSGALRIFATSLLSGHTPPIFEDGEQQRDFINIHDVVAANLLALEDDRMIGEPFNVGSGTKTTVRTLYALVARCLKKKHKLVPKSKERYRVGDTRHALSDITKLTALGWQPRYTVADSVKQYIAWLLATQKA